MKTTQRLFSVAILSTSLLLTLNACGKDDTKAVSFQKQIKPLFEARCIDCHHAGALFGDLNLENRDLAFKPRKKGPVITPGDPDKSTLYLVLTLPESDKKAMPPTGHRISAEETALIKRWIKEGAAWPTGADGVVKPKVNLDKKGA